MEISGQKKKKKPGKLETNGPDQIQAFQNEIAYHGSLFFKLIKAFVINHLFPVFTR